jgi:outer membrane protein OmpA-like peptidoglycan-associated protein
MEPSTRAGAVQIIDGDPRTFTLTTGTEGPLEFTFKMPSETTFQWFGVPEVAVSEGNVASFGSMTISGSVEGADTGFITLAEATFEFGSPGEIHAVVPDMVTPVRWLRVRLEGEIDAGQPSDERTRFEFTELIGTGMQDEQPLSNAFTGAWELAHIDRPDARGERLELSQDGAVVTGCLDSFEIRGTVNGSVARATGYDPSTGQSSAVVFVADEDGSIAATVSFDNGRFEARVALPPPRSSGSLCVAPTAEDAVCDVPLYINFEADSAEIRSESIAILSDIYRLLSDLGIETATIEGHTSTEGTDEYNRDLSQQRASAVAVELVALGFPSGALTTVGLGESEPIVFPDDDESARAINRRVEIVCR